MGNSAWQWDPFNETLCARERLPQGRVMSLSHEVQSLQTLCRQTLSLFQRA